MKLFIREFIGGCLLLLPTLVVAQDIETRDSLKLDFKHTDYDESININFRENRILRTETDYLINSKPSFYPLRLQPLSFTLPKEGNPLAPFIGYHYSNNNNLEGLVRQGMHNRFELNNFLTADLNIFMSGYSNAFFQPNIYVNGSAKIDLIFKLHERVQLVGIGQISLREGIDPKLPSSFGNANYYGAGIQIKVTDKVGFGVGVTNSYFRGDWTKQTYFTPVGY